MTLGTSFANTNGVMKNILPEEDLKQLEQIGFVSVEQLKTMLEDAHASDADVELLHDELQQRGVVITETPPPHPPRHPHNPEADPHVINEIEELNG